MFQAPHGLLLRDICLIGHVYNIQNIDPRIKWQALRRKQFWFFFVLKWIYFDSNFTIFSQWFNPHASSISSDNGLAPNRKEAVVWNNDGIIHWRIYAALGLWASWYPIRHQRACFCVSLNDISIYDIIHMALCHCPILAEVMVYQSP